MAQQERSCTVLICERDEKVVEQIQRTLQAGAWKVVGVATSGDEAIILAQRHKPDIIIMALGLEGERDGLAVMRRILKLQTSAAVLLSEDTSSIVVKAAVEAGAFGLLATPLDTERILQTLLTARKVYDMVHDAFESVYKIEAELLSDASTDKMLDHAESVLQKVKSGEAHTKTKRRTEFIH